MTEMTPNTSSVNALVARGLASAFRFAADPDVIFDETARKLSGTDNAEGLCSVDGKKLALASGVGSQYTIADAVDEQYAPLAVSFARQLIAEYGCKTPGEIAMVEVVAVSYVHFLEASKLMRVYKRDPIVDKKVDRAHRRYISALGALRQMKAPSVSVKVITQNAFVAQNQVNGAV